MRTFRTTVVGLFVCGALPGIEAAAVAQERGYIGVGLRPIDSATADREKLPTGKGEIVAAVEPHAPADRVGVRQGDIIVQVNGRDVSPQSTVASLVAASLPGARVVLRLVRDGRSFQVEPKVGKRPTEKQLSTTAGETPESRAQSYIDDARATIAASNARLKDKSIGCDSTEAGDAGLKIARVDGLMQGLVNTQPRFPSYMQASVSRAIANLGTEAGRLRLEQADGFLATGCNPQADTLYRFVLSNFSSPAFEGLRQRAQVGIDDVRARGK